MNVEPEAGTDTPLDDASTAKTGARIALTLAALGVVYGDIGTSPLYAIQTVFSIDNGAVRATPGDVFGVISLVFWSITLIVSVKYVTFILRAGNEGEGGVMALAALVRRVLGTASRSAILVMLGVFGASLFYGDSMITPAISVLSAVEGLKVAAPSLSHLVIPFAVTILAVLFLIQRWGTHRVGRLFGPVMVIWFAVLAATGLGQIVPHPGILKGLSPSYAVSFFSAHPYIAFVAMGAVVLSITGAEALYADMGHFGRAPIRRAWFGLVFPALTLNYLGQAALILHDPTTIKNPFFLLMPGWGQMPMVALATAATVIASQSVISGAFSVSRQAMQLGFLPRLTIRHTSEREIGQVYVPAVNWLLFVGVLILMLGFRSSARLATAYGVAVTGTFIITTTLFLVVARSLWRWPLWQVGVAALVFGGVELAFFAANLTKIAHGGWLPLLIALTLFTVMMTWQRGREIVTANRRRKEGSLQGFIDELHEADVPRIPGTAVFPHPSKETAPLAMRANVEHNHVLHENVVIVSAKLENVPHIRRSERLSIDDLGYSDDGIVHLTVRYGFQDDPNIPDALRQAWEDGLGLDGDPELASYFLSRISLRYTDAPGMSKWRKRLFIALAHNAASPAEFFRLPDEQTVIMGAHIDV
ncbi:MAG: family potassium uptake protein [Actinomycetia bacterium]|nr:family potassium uptake protein [Actinomycetes bacterium]